MCIITEVDVKPYKRKRVAYKIMEKVDDDIYRALFGTRYLIRVRKEEEAIPYLDHRSCCERKGFHSFITKKEAQEVLRSLINDSCSHDYSNCRVVKVKVRQATRAGYTNMCYATSNIISIMSNFITIIEEV